MEPAHPARVLLVVYLFNIKSLPLFSGKRRRFSW